MASGEKRIAEKLKEERRGKIQTMEEGIGTGREKSGRLSDQWINDSSRLMR